MGSKKQKIVKKENYIRGDNIGEDLLLRNQIIINLDTEEWITLAFKSNVFYKNLLLESNIYHPNKFVNIKVSYI